MKTKFIFFTLLLGLVIHAQEKVVCKTGKVIFEASASSFEEIKAKNENVICAINTKTGEVASVVLIKLFKFKVALMQEHFNENYLESDKYPKSTLLGKIENFNINKITTEGETFILTGVLQIHGVSKNVSIPIKIKKTTNGGINLVSKFNIKLDDFKIEVPSIIGYKLAKSVVTEVNFDLY